MSYKVLTLDDKEEWNKYLEKLPIELQDVYYTPEYYALYEAKGDGEVNCFVYQEGDQLILYPYLKNEINKIGYTLDKTYFDIQGCYGLNGPLTNSNDKEFYRRFRLGFKEMCLAQNIVAEFTRFNPLLANEQIFNENEILLEGNTVNVLLDIDVEELWMKSFSRDVRRIISKGVAAGYTYKVLLLEETSSQDIADFNDIYFSTLDRNKADSYYYFDRDFISNMKNNLGGKVLYSSVFIDGKVIAVSINPFLNFNSYGFLGGSLREYQKISPFTFMMNVVIRKLKELGVKNYFLGGGREGIIKYKRNFNKNDIRAFYIGKAIYNREVYDDIIKQWRNNKTDKYDSCKLLRYRDI